ncbi:MAG: C10 family peptidase, partial [Bacteroidaceae bacterium]|nr:C10 family peptidase [Bacteroidaceae bacterium]
MKTLLLAVLLLPLALTANADPITREQAQQKAERHLQGKPGSRKLSPVVSSRKLSPRRGAAATSPETYYAFNRGEGDGFVLVAADDRISPVLGYTDDGEFDYNTIPDNMRTWLDAQERYVRYLQEHPDYATAAVPVHDAIPEMLTTRWNQGAPYNDLTPRKSNGNATVTGCVATAMAQVLYYQHSKSVDELQATIPGYTTWTQKLEVESIPQGSPIDWKNMLNTYGSNASAVQKKAVAQLMKYCGAAVHMDYDDSSGAQPGEVPGAINTYFGYTTARIVWQSDFNEVSWDALLYDELANGRVAYLGGYNPNAGHAFVCDGYDGNHCFHINWGWGGSSNGYFLLTALTPGQQGIGGSEDGSGFTDNQNAVIGCEPTDYHNKALPITNSTVKKACLANFDTDGDGVFTYGEAAAVTDLGDAFKGQRFTSFTELYYFTSLTTVTEGAFEGCTSLTTVKLPKHLKAIGARAFQGCTALKTFVLPEGLTTIEDGAFDGCKAFT